MLYLYINIFKKRREVIHITKEAAQRRWDELTAKKKSLPLEPDQNKWAEVVRNGDTIRRRPKKQFLKPC